MNSNKYIEMFANDQETVSIIATCPSGYKQYTDKPGNSVCCAGKIDYIGSTCQGKACTLHTKVEDPNKPGMFYEKCSDASYKVIKNKFNAFTTPPGGPSSHGYNLKTSKEVKDLETYKKLYCDNDKKCFGVAEINVTINNKEKVKAFYAFPKVNLTDLISTPVDNKNGYVWDEINLYIKN